MPVRVVGDLAKMRRKLEGLKQPRLVKLGKTVGEALVSSSIQRFNDQRAPDGTPWKSLSRATIEGSVRSSDLTKRGRLRSSAARRMAARLMLVQSARLRNSIASTLRGTVVHVGTNVKYARLHQLGGQAGRRSARVIVPARPFLGISAEDKAEIRRQVRDAVTEGD
ncbi:MAG: phage virion morphogenesis protein [Pleurocapsa sp. SU_196_0]|nr:phage virion morphogenesis protein [Pleurocapsa sp. SU_196_0]